MNIDPSPFEKALKTLNKALSIKNDDNNFIRDSAIQRFEYTYGLAIKFIQRQLEEMMANEGEVDKFTFNDLMRTAAEKGLIDNPVVWFRYREIRNITSHTYNEEKAEKVYSILNDFAKSAEYLLNIIKRLNK